MCVRHQEGAYSRLTLVRRIQRRTKSKADNERSSLEGVPNKVIDEECEELCGLRDLYWELYPSCSQIRWAGLLEKGGGQDVSVEEVGLRVWR